MKMASTYNVMYTLSRIWTLWTEPSIQIRAMAGKANLQALTMLEFVICYKVNAALGNVIVIFL